MSFFYAIFVFFFFKQKTAYEMRISDWSSDVCSSDLLEDAREISGRTVVVAPCQASVQIAANLANRFSIIIGQEKWAVQMRERVEAYGYSHTLASMRSIVIGVPDLQKDCDLTTARILEAGRRAIDEAKDRKSGG